MVSTIYTGLEGEDMEGTQKCPCVNAMDKKNVKCVCVCVCVCVWGGGGGVDRKQR